MAQSARLTWEPFDPKKIGCEALSRWLTEFYQMPPWNMYVKCFACGGRDDFGPQGRYGRPEVEARGLTCCPCCGGHLELYWSPERIEEYFRQLRSKGPLLGFTALVGQEPAGWIWGYEITPRTPAPWGKRVDGRGMYGDVIHVLPHRNGPVALYLILTALRQLKENGFQYVIARTHRQADYVRLMFHKLGFQELGPCPYEPERSYWLRVLSEVKPANASSLKRP